MEEIIWYREMVWHSNADSIGTVTYQRTDIDSMNACLQYLHLVSGHGEVLEVIFCIGSI